jgi:hypothetical protein
MVDDWTLEYHLTPQGWLKGTLKYFSAAVGPEIPRPEDAVETWIERSRQPVGVSSPERYSSAMLWWTPEWSPDRRAALRAQFAAPFKIEED